MPLKRSCSVEAYRANVEELTRSGRDPKQAAAIAHDTLRTACSDAGQPTPNLDAVDSDPAPGFVIDAAPLGAARRLPNGFLRAPATLTRAGVLVYRLANGSTRRELRPPEEVFSTDSLATLELAPLTLEHPEPIGTPVTSDNVKDLGVGHLGQTFDRDGNLLGGEVLVEDAGAVRDVDSGERQEVSLGYWRRLDLTPGTWNGVAYDAIQRDIRYNHAAITKRGRAGPDVRIRLDSETAVLVGDAADHNPPPEGVNKMPKFQLAIDGITHEIECTESTGATIKKRLADQDTKVTSLDTALVDARKKADEAEAKADAAETARKKAEEQITDSLKPEKVAELVERRLDLEREAGPILNADKADADQVDVAKMADDEIRKAVILVDDAEAKLDGKSADYLAARYEAAVVHLATDEATSRRQAASVSRNAARTVAANPVVADAAKKAEEARSKMIEETHGAWRKGIDDEDQASA